MQIIESTAFGVRSAILHFKARDTAPSFVLFPMVHVADPEFYAEISQRLEACDLVLCEGVTSSTVSLLTLSYRFFADIPRLGLVTQKTMKLDHLKDRLIQADVTGEAFEKRWWRLKSWIRFVAPLAAPFFGLYMRTFGTRAALARVLGTDLLRSRHELLAGSDQGELNDLFLGWRDRHLLEVIEQQRCKQENADRRIAVVFGAEHMRAVIHHLVGKHGYRVAKAEWATVITL